jgi:hypothetical protein
MANDTVVQYVLKVDASGAQKALDTTSKEAEGASKSLDRIEHSSKGAVQGLERVEKQSRDATKAARNFRRAGRDLDGALGDLAQGIGHVNPQLGHFLMSASDGVSIVEGLGRGMTLLLNPAVAVAATVAIAAGAAFAYMDAQQQEAEQRAKDLAAAIEESNKIIEEQEKIANNARETIADYATQLDQARIQLHLLTGATTEAEQKTRQNEQAVKEFSQVSTQAYLDERKALEETARQQDKRLQQIQEEIDLLKEQRRITQTVRQEQLTGAKFGAATAPERELRTQAAQIQEERAATQRLIESNSQNFDLVQGQAQEYKEILQQTLEIEQAEQRRKAAEKARVERLRRERAEQRQREKEQQQILKAQEQIEKILETAKFSQLDAVGKINATYEQQANKLFDLAEISGDIETANAALVELGKIRNQQLDAEAAKQEEIKQKEEERAKKEEERARKQAERDAERARKEAERARKEAEQARQEQQQAAIDTFETIVSLDAASIVSIVSPLAGAFTGIVQSLGEKVIEKGPAQIRAEALAQAEAIKVGIAFLPELLLSIAPQLGIAIAEAFLDGFLLIFVNLKDLIIDAFNTAFSFRDRSPDGNDRARRRQRRRQGLLDFINPFESATFMGGGRFVPSAQGGIRFTGAQDGLAQLHRGEFVVPQSGQRPQQVDRQLNNTTGGGMTININSAVVDRNAVDALVREIEIRFNNQFGTSSSSLFGGR